MDWTGQKHAEWLYQLIICLFSTLGFGYAYAQQDFTHCFHAWLVGLAIASAVAIPNWGVFNRNPITFLDELPEEWRTREYDENGDVAIKESDASAGKAQQEQQQQQQQQGGGGGSKKGQGKKNKKKKKGKH